MPARPLRAARRSSSHPKPAPGPARATRGRRRRATKGCTRSRDTSFRGGGRRPCRRTRGPRLAATMDVVADPLRVFLEALPDRVDLEAELRQLAVEIVTHGPADVSASIPRSL